MGYIEAILTNHQNEQCPFRIDSDNMKELINKALLIVTNFISDDDHTFNIIAFNSNTLSKDSFLMLMNIHLEMQELEYS